MGTSGGLSRSQPFKQQIREGAVDTYQTSAVSLEL
jgi:hypothetical protein